MAFVRNAWYVAEWAGALREGQLLARRILDEPIVLFRSEQGISALYDRCLHRFAPLSLGTLSEGHLQCGYHGLRYDSAGVCVGNPHGAVPRNAVVRRYAAVEKHGAIWIWMGDASDASAADPATIPDFSYMDAADPVTVVAEYMLTRTNYENYNDNILDLSHTDFLHPTSLGSGAITTAKAEVTTSGDAMKVRWWCPDVQAPAAYEPYMKQPGAPVDFCIEIDWYPAGLMKLVTSVTPAGRPQSEGIQSRNAHFLTPETKDSTHYFYYSTRDYNINAEATAARRHLIKTAFEGEDRPMVEAVQNRMGGADLLDLKPLLLSTDAAGMRARRILNGIKDREHVQRPAARESIPITAS